MQTGMIDPAVAASTTPGSTPGGSTAGKTAAKTAAAKTDKADKGDKPDKKPANSSLDKNAFLSLLVAQLKNQDPTNAQDPNAMVAQMAQFSTLEQQQNTNALLGSMQNQMSALFQSQSTGLLGKNVQVTSNSLNLSGGNATVGLNLPADANVILTIKNAAGDTVATMNKGAMTKGSQVVKWNGQDANHHKLPDGSYTVAIAAMGKDGKPVPVTTTSMAKVNAVAFDDGEMKVFAGGQKYPLSAINVLAQ